MSDRDPYADPRPGDRFEFVCEDGRRVPFEVVKPIRCPIPGSVLVEDAWGRRRFDLRRDRDVFLGARS